MSSRVMRVDKEFEDYVKQVQQTLGIKSQTEITKMIARTQPVISRRPLGAAIDDLLHKEVLGKRKGSITDLGFIMMGTVIMAISFFVAVLILQEYQAIPVFSQNTIAATTIAQGIAAFSVIDASFIFLIIGFGLSSAISAFFIRTHPLFFVVSLISWCITFFMSAIFSNVFNSFVSTPAFSSVIGTFSNLISVGQNFPIVVALIGAIIMVALYAKGGSSGRPF